MRRRTKVEILRAREADWIFMLDKGYSMTTDCAGCGERKVCRGVRRSNLRCHECFVGVRVPA